MDSKDDPRLRGQQQQQPGIELRQEPELRVVRGRAKKTDPPPDPDTPIAYISGFIVQRRVQCQVVYETVEVRSMFECADACTKDPRCAVFTMLDAVPPVSRRTSCYLSDNTSACWAAAKGWIAGYKGV